MLTPLAAAALMLLAGTAGVTSAVGADEPAQRVLTVRDPRIVESSGLAASWSLPGVLWTVNDSGDGPRVFGIGPGGRTVAVLTLGGAVARDWEAVAVGPAADGGSALWVGDIGDNESVWPSVRVYRVAEPDSRGDRTVTWEAYDLVYPDGPRDAEALLVDPSAGRLFVVSKRVQGAAIYAAPRTLRTDRVNRLSRVSAAPPLVTDGAFARDGRLALRDYLQASLSAGVGADSARLTLPFLPQGESLTWTLDSAALLVGSEGERSDVWRVPVAVPEAPVKPEDPEDAEVSEVPEVVDAAQQPRAWQVALGGLLLGGALAGLAAARRRRARQTAEGREAGRP